MSLLGHATQTTCVDLADDRLLKFADRLELAHVAFLGLAANAASVDLTRALHLPMLCSWILLMRRLEHGIMNRQVCSNLAYALSRVWNFVNIDVLIVAEKSACESQTTFHIIFSVSMTLAKIAEAFTIGKSIATEYFWRWVNLFLMIGEFRPFKVWVSFAVQEAIDCTFRDPKSHARRYLAPLIAC